jgi:hypothetical protein
MVSEHNNKNFSQLLLISLAQQSVQEQEQEVGHGNEKD